MSQDNSVRVRLKPDRRQTVRTDDVSVTKVRFPGRTPTARLRAELFATAQRAMGAETWLSVERTHGGAYVVLVRHPEEKT